MPSKSESPQSLAELARTQWREALKKVTALRVKAEKSWKKLSTRGRELSAQVQRLKPSGRISLERWQNRLLESAGVATRTQLREISRELARVSKRLDTFSPTKLIA